jgi:hypothetical protein
LPEVASGAPIPTLSDFGFIVLVLACLLVAWRRFSEATGRKL